MKYIYRISLTFMILTILSAALLGSLYIYQNRGKNKISTQEQIEETSAVSEKTDCDTEYIILEKNLVSGKSESLIEEIPAKYIGKTKEQLVSLLSEEERAPSLRDRQKGIQSVRLSAFSNERVVIVKTYEIKPEQAGVKVTDEDDTDSREEDEDPEEAAETMQTDQKKIDDEATETGPYYLMVNNGMVCVYQEDMQTMYLATGIMADDLPDDVRQEILDKKYMKNEEELYNFLESYSS